MGSYTAPAHQLGDQTRHKQASCTYVPDNNPKEEEEQEEVEIEFLP